MKRRDIIVCIMLSIVTFGLYYVYWLVTLTDDLNSLTPDDTYQCSGWLAFILMLVTCGIYGIYWHYRLGVKVDLLNKFGGNHNILFPVLNIFGFGVVNCCIMQNVVNQHTITV